MYTGVSMPDDKDPDVNPIENFVLLNLLTNITSGNWKFAPLYKESQTGGTLYWQAGYDEFSNELITVHGYHITSTGNIGKLTTDRIIIEPKVNRKFQEQALLEIKSKYVDKIREGYHNQSLGIFENISSLPGPQLGNKYTLPGQIGKDVLKPEHFSRGISVQAKLDGIRCRAFILLGEIKLYTRNNVEHVWLDHIKKELSILFKNLPIGIGIDGEIYNSNLKFEELTSIVRTKNVIHPKNNLLEFYMFDIIVLETILEDRIKLLYDAYTEYTKDHMSQYIHLLSHNTIYNKDDIKIYHDNYVNLGYEGLILRKLAGPNRNKLTKRQIEETWYKPGKNNNMLKVKQFNDEEGTVIDMKSGIGRETGLAILIIKDDRGNVFECRPRGSFEIREEWLKNKEKYIGKRFTYRYFELTEYGLPRFPVGIGFRDYE